MEHILKNELLYKEGEIEIYKTYHKDEDRYGLYWHSPDGYRRSDSKYVLIHPYEQQRAAGLRLLGGFEWSWVWVDTDLHETLMDELDSVIWECLRVEDSRCNCFGTPDFVACELCVFGIIECSFNFKKVIEQEGTIIYTYDTEEAFYTIRLSECGACVTPDAKYTWMQEELDWRLKGIINTYEEQIYELEENMRICVLKQTEDGDDMQEVYYDVTIERIVLPKPESGNCTRHIIRYDDYPYSAD